MYRGYMDTSGRRVLTLLNCIPSDMQRVLTTTVANKATLLLLSMSNLNIKVDTKRIPDPRYNDEIIANYAVDYDYANILIWLIKTDGYISYKIFEKSVRVNAIKSFIYLCKLFPLIGERNRDLSNDLFIMSVKYTHYAIADYIYGIGNVTATKPFFSYLELSSASCIKYLWDKGYRPTTEDVNRYLRYACVEEIIVLIKLGYQHPTSMLEGCIRESYGGHFDKTQVQLVKYIVDNGLELLQTEHLSYVVSIRQKKLTKYMLGVGLRLTDKSLKCICQYPNKEFCKIAMNYGHDLSPWLSQEKIDEIIADPR
jgi:hypothetical protein